MKAKMKTGEKPPEEGNYHCQKCRTQFKSTVKTKLVCPKCGTTTLGDLIPIYMEDDPEEEQMYSSSEWHGGD